MIDPISKSNWLDRVSQEHSALYFLAHGQAAIVILLVILASILTFATASLSVLVNGKREGIAGIAIILAVAWASLIFTLLLSRYIRFVFAFAPLFLPFAMRLFETGSAFASGRARKAAAACVAAYMVLTSWLIAATRPSEAAFDAADYMAYDDCRDGDFSTLTTLPPGGIAAPQALGVALLDVMPSGFSVAAVPFHRASPGMKRMFEAFLTTDPQIRRAALSPFTYVAICRFPLTADVGEAPLYDALARGGDWPGLVRIPSDQANRLQLFRIDHSTLK